MRAQFANRLFHVIFVFVLLVSMVFSNFGLMPSSPVHAQSEATPTPEVSLTATLENVQSDEIPTLNSEVSSTDMPTETQREVTPIPTMKSIQSGVMLTSIPVMSLSVTSQNVPHWVEYHDLRYKFGLAIPNSWSIEEASLEGIISTTVVMNYDDSDLTGKELMSENAVKIEFQGIELDSKLSIEDNLDRYAEGISATILSFNDADEGSFEGKIAEFQYASGSKQKVYIAIQEGIQILLIRIFPMMRLQKI